MAVTKSKKSTASHLADARAKRGKDHSPKWDGCESWNIDQFLKFFRQSMDYYRLEKSGKELKPEVINWMGRNGYTKDQIKAFKDTRDNRCSSTVGSIAANLNRGMPAVREDFNNGKNTAQWLGEQIAEIIQAGKNDYEPEIADDKPAAPVISIQDRLRDASYAMTEEIEDALEEFHKDHDAFNPKAFKLLNLLKGRQAKAAHARIIRDLYAPQLAEYEEVLEGKCEQLKEGYSHISKKNMKKLIEFYQEIAAACTMLMQEAKVNKKPRARRAKPAEKIVEKMKYCKTNEPLKLVSINPTDILGAKELWIFNTKTRKLGKYVAAEFADLGVKGTSITGFDEHKSVQKTLRKPEEQLKEFKAAGKVVLRKFLEDIKAVDIKLNGRINEDTVLLKVQ
jgi:predicted transcriptional regulator